MKILFVSSEIAPYAKSGGLADVAGALPDALRGLGDEVLSVMPAYSVRNDSGLSFETIGEIDVPVAYRTEKATLLLSVDRKLLLIKNDCYFGRKGLYQENGLDYEDNDLRFAFFCRAVLEAVKKLSFHCNVIHCNDWQSALIPLYLRHHYREDPFFDGCATLYTIHNLAYQGVFETGRALRVTEVPPSLYHPDSVEFWGNFSFIKGGLCHADLITTVSERYASEIRTGEFGFGLDGLLRSRSGDLFGIVNGIDRTVWNPETEPIPFSASDTSGKAANKLALQRRFSFPESAETPVLAYIGRLIEQKGVDLLLDSLAELLNRPIQLVILGNGIPELEERLRGAAFEYRGRLGVEFGFDDPCARLIYAGADLMVLPSRFEPCGIVQMIAMRYGTPPVAHATGGLADTIHDFDENDASSNGFLFRDCSIPSLLESIDRALDLYRNRERWGGLVHRAMEYDFGWDRSAKRYRELYSLALQRIGG